MGISATVMARCHQCGQDFETPRVSIHEGAVARLCLDCLVEKAEPKVIKQPKIKKAKKK